MFHNISIFSFLEQMDRDRPKTIHEDVEVAGFENRENIQPATSSRTKIEMRDTPNKDTPNR